MGRWIKRLNKRLFLLSVVGFGVVGIITILGSRDMRVVTGFKSLTQLPHVTGSNLSNADQIHSSHSSPKTNVVFIKVHKAASTTVQNILLRFSLTRKLNVFLPKDPDEPHINEHSSRLRANNTIDIPPGTHFNILTHHLIFDKAQIRQFFPDDTVYIAIVREPYSRFVSSLYYYGAVWEQKGLRNCMPLDDPVNAFLRNPNKFDPPKKASWSQVNNRLLRDFGMTKDGILHSKNDDSIVKTFLKKLDTQLDLVMIMEHFDDSIIMLKRLLNWTFKDLLYMKINQLSTEVKRKTIENSEKNKDLYKKYAPSEFILYDHFLSKFTEKANALGHDFSEELQAFREIRKRAESFCKERHGANNHTRMEFQRTLWSETFHVSYEDCNLMKMDELPLTGLVRFVQNKRLSDYYRRVMHSGGW